MKIVISLLFLLCFGILSAQKSDTLVRSDDALVTFGVYGSVPAVNVFGISIENNGEKTALGFTHDLLNVGYGFMSYDDDLDSGKGFQFELGHRIFVNALHQRKGFFFENFLSYAFFDFDQDLHILYYDNIDGENLKTDFKGKYSYFSFVSPDVGWKFLLCKSLSVDVSAGATWKIEVKGKGDIDNKHVDNWIPKFGAGFAYEF